MPINKDVLTGLLFAAFGLFALWASGDLSIGTTSPPPKPGPGYFAAEQPFIDAAAKGVLAVPKCTSCGRKHWYPRPLCPFCWSDAIVWESTSGTGTIYSFSILRHATDPYTIAYVTLDDGPTMLTNLVDCPLEALRIGDRVRLAFRTDEGGRPWPAFTPDRQAESETRG